MLGVTKLNVGAGSRLLPGFIQHDVLKLEGIDLVCEMFDLPKHIKEDSLEEIDAFHILEHFGTDKTHQVLKLWRNLLKEGGLLRLEVPNFRYHSQLCLSGEEEKAIYYCFGGQVDEWDYHKTAFTTNILHKELQSAGFKDINIKEESSLLATAIK